MDEEVSSLSADNCGVKNDCGIVVVCDNSEHVGNEHLVVADFENISRDSNDIRGVVDCRDIAVDIDSSDFG